MTKTKAVATGQDEQLLRGWGRNQFRPLKAPSMHNQHGDDFMLPYTIAVEIDQEQRAQEALDDLLEGFDEIEIYLAQTGKGEFDGKLGLPPESPDCWWYWEGYQNGLKEHWLKKLGRNLETPF